jgi:hypothetical protein
MSRWRASNRTAMHACVYARTRAVPARLCLLLLI